MCIRDSSTPGQGSCFSIYLPLCGSGTETIKKRTRKKTAVPKSAKRILLVEDERKILKMFDRALRGAGYEVLAMSSPLAALEKLKNTSFDVVVTDYSMPGMKGGQLAAQIHKMGLNCRIIMITGLVEDQVIEYYRSHLIHALLVKPLEVQTLIDAIEKDQQPLSFE